MDDTSNVPSGTQVSKLKVLAYASAALVAIGLLVTYLLSPLAGLVILAADAVIAAACWFVRPGPVSRALARVAALGAAVLLVAFLGSNGNIPLPASYVVVALGALAWGYLLSGVLGRIDSRNDDGYQAITDLVSESDPTDSVDPAEEVQR